jgi:hypothetical protein
MGYLIRQAVPSQAGRWPRSWPVGARRHDLACEGASGGHDDPPSVGGADYKTAGVSLLKDAQHVGNLLAGTWSGPPPADYNPLADIGGCEPDL